MINIGYIRKRYAGVSGQAADDVHLLLNKLDGLVRESNDQVEELTQIEDAYEVISHCPSCASGDHRSNHEALDAVVARIKRPPPPTTEVMADSLVPTYHWYSIEPGAKLLHLQDDDDNRAILKLTDIPHLAAELKELSP